MGNELDQRFQKEGPHEQTHRQLAAAGALAVLGIVIPAGASQDNPQRIEKADVSGLHDFDFLVGEWRVQHRRLKERLANNREWVEFGGTCSNRTLMEGWGNVDENRSTCQATTIAASACARTTRRPGSGRSGGSTRARRTVRSIRR